MVMVATSIFCVQSMLKTGMLTHSQIFLLIAVVEPFRLFFRVSGLQLFPCASVNPFMYQPLQMLICSTSSKFALPASAIGSLHNFFYRLPLHQHPVICVVCKSPNYNSKCIRAHGFLTIIL